MLFTVALFNLLLFPAVLAVPSVLGARVVHRRTSGVFDKSLNWAGSILSRSNGNFNTVIGTFTVPTPSGSPGDAAAAWVGIDGRTCAGALLQTGVTFMISSTGQPEYSAWYEWIPDAAYGFSNITISAGDNISLSVIAYSSTSGVAKIENLTTGDMEEQSLTSTSPLCGWDAEWIVEDFLQNGNLVPFANFGTVTFENAIVGSQDGGAFTASQGSLVNIDQNDTLLTTTSASGSTVTIKYV